jgi:hypothetical protein
MEDSAVKRIRQEHSAELQSLLKGHVQQLELLRSEHEFTVNELRASLDNAKQRHQADFEDHTAAHSKAISDLEASHSQITGAMTRDHELLVQEMENSLSASEEQRRQLKMKADQALFEISRVRDEHQIQRNTDSKRLADLEKAYTTLENIRSDLEAAKVDLTRRISEMEERYNNRTSLQPPQGPPPRVPLPPLPASASLRSEGDSTRSSACYDRSMRRSLSGVAEPGVAITVSPERTGAMGQEVVEERKVEVIELDSLKQQIQAEKERVEEMVCRVYVGVV